MEADQLYFGESSAAEGMKSPGAVGIKQRLEECLIYARDKRRVYKDPKDLALDFGKNGTQKFFPLPMLLALIEEDTRFKPYLANLRIADF